jgi:hypothetical protein
VSNDSSQYVSEMQEIAISIEESHDGPASEGLVLKVDVFSFLTSGAAPVMRSTIPARSLKWNAMSHPIIC